MRNSTNKFGRRALALLLALTMCFSMVMSAAAETTMVNTNKIVCGLEEHTHGNACYEYFALTCEQLETEAHYHNPDICGESEVGRDLICVSVESEGHAHGETCYTTEENSTLTCGFDESEEHTHDANCYTEGTVSNLTCEQGESQGHTHDDSCYKVIMGYDCGLEETDGHKHTTEECYEWVNYSEALGDVSGYVEVPYDSSVAATASDPNYKRLSCTTEEHTHTDECIGQKTNEEVLNEVNNALQSGDKNVTLNLQDDFILEEKDPHHGTPNAAIGVVGSGAQLTITGQGTIKAMEAGFAVIRIVGGKVIINGDVTITGGDNTGDTGNGGGVYLKGGELELNKGTISGNTAQKGGGVYVTGGGKFTMTGGTIENNQAESTNIQDAHKETNEYGSKWDYKAAGGGVYVGKDSTFTTNGSNEDIRIQNNSAAEGGGIFVYNGGNLNMNGGTVDGNKALEGEGGGIYIKGTGEITKGLITGNSTATTIDLGGGGIYIENTGTLKLTNALVAANTANGLGGGIAACIHGRTVVFAKNGAAIFGNTGNGDALVHKRKPLNTGLNTPTSEANPGVDSSNLWKDDKAFKDGAQDIFSAGDIDKIPDDGRDQLAGISVSNQMLASLKAGWTGQTFNHKEDCPALTAQNNGTTQCTCSPNYDKKEINDSNSSSIYAGLLMGLTSQYKQGTPEYEAAYAAVMAFIAEQGGVVISGNTSATHGGGIANNGVLIIGQKEVEDGIINPVDVTVHKKWTTDDESVKDPSTGLSVQVQMTGPNYNETKTIIGDGQAVFTLSSDYLKAQAPTAGSHTLTFTVTETPGDNPNVTWDPTPYKVTVTVTRTEEEHEIGEFKGDNKLKTITYTVASEGTDITFNNTYKAPRGSLKLTKAVNGILNADSEEIANKTFKFQIQGPGYNKTVEIKGTGSITLNDLIAGEYTVTEVDADAQIDGYQVTVSGNGGVTVNGGVETDVTVTNTYDYKRGSLTLSKKILNNTDLDALNQKYTFKVTGEMLDADQQKGDYEEYQTGEDNALYVSLHGEDTVTINGLPYGSYSVTELKAGVDESKYHWTITNDNQNGATISKPSGAEVEITNTFDYYRGSLTINKVITGAASTSETKDKVFTFTVTGPEHVTGTFDGITFEKGNATVTITGDGQKTISGLPAGTYRVHEENAELGGYTWTVKGNDQSVEVTEGGNAAVTVTNTYDVPFIPTTKTKSITVNKAWAGDEDAGIQRPASVQVQLMVNGAASGGPVTLSAANDWRHTWSGLAESAVLSVKEIDVPAGYVAVTSQNGSTIVITNTYKATPTPTPTPTPGPSQEPTPTPEPDEEIPDDDVPLGPGPEEPDEEIPDDDVPLGPGPEEPDEEIPDDDVPLGPGPEPTPEPDEELPDPDVPTGPAEPEEEDIPDEEVPLANTPKTGDDISLWYLLTALSAAGLVFLAVTGRMRKQAGK